MNRTFLAGGLLAAALMLAACGGATDDITDDTTDVGADPTSDPAAGACLEGTPDCDDTGILDGDDAEAEPSAGMCIEDEPDCADTVVAGGEEEEPAEPVGDEFDSPAAIAQAEELLGLPDTELSPDVRIGRRGEEHMMLTEDYVLGRMTVELDINDMDEWIVTAVTVELPDGPQTFTQYLP